MLLEQTFQQLSTMRMHGFTKALQEQVEKEDLQKLAFDERVSLLVDREYRDREDRKLTRRLQQARLREHACLEDIDYRHSRGLDKALIRRLGTCSWLTKNQNVIITGPTKTVTLCITSRSCWNHWKEGALSSATWKMHPRARPQPTSHVVRESRS